MKPYLKTAYFLLSLILICSCNRSAKNSADAADSDKIMTRPDSSRNEVTLNNNADTVAHPEMAAHVKVLIHQMTGYGKDTIFAREAAAVLEKVINSEAFRTAVISNTYKHDNNLTPIEIYNQIMQAHEISGPGGQDHVIDLRLRTINNDDDAPVWMQRCESNSSSGTIGIDGGGSGIAAVCPQWLHSTADQHKPEWLAAHFMHEYMHILGFKHPTQKNKSVPYKIHYIIETLGAQENLQ